jgi:autotransporter-associated beta strand protein
LWSTNSAGTIAPDVSLTTSADDLFFSAGTNGTAGTVTVSDTQFANSIRIQQASVTLSGGTINLGSAAAGSGFSFTNSTGINVNSPIILNSASSDFTFANTGNQAVTFGATATLTGSAASGTQTLTIGGGGLGGGSLTVNGIIGDGDAGGKVGVTVNGAAGAFTSGNLYTLGGANTYTGPTQIITGTLGIGNSSTLANTSAILLGPSGRLTVNAANSSLAKLSTAGGGSGVVAGSILRYSQPQTAAGTGPGRIFGTVELNANNVNPNYTLDFGSGAVLTNLVAATYTSPLTLSGNATIDASPSNATFTATYATGGITASTAGAKTLVLTGTNTTANTISGDIANGSGSISITKTGGGNWILSGTNTYTGDTRVDLGTLQFTNQVSLYNNGAAATWTNDNIIVGDGATLALNIGGAGQFTKANVITLLGLSDSPSNGFNSGSSLGLDTTAGDFLFDSVIANTNGGANVLGLSKLGTNTLTLDQNNTYTGRTLISGGTLQLGNGGTTGALSTTSTILNNGTLTINRSNPVAQGTDFTAAPISGTGGLIQAGSGTTTLSSANTFSGTTTVSAGVLNLTNERALQNSALVTTGSGTVTFTGFTTPVLGGLSGGSGDLASIIPGFDSTELTINNGSNVSYGGIISDGSGAMSLVKNGNGTQTLTGANTFTGATIVNAGTLTLGAGGSLSSSSTLQMGGGTFTFSNTSASQSLNGLVVNGGNSIINNTVASQILDLGAITRTGSSYGTISFANRTGAIGTTTGNTNGIIGAWATTGTGTNLRYAVGSADGVTMTDIAALTGTTATANLGNVTDATENYEYSGAATTSGDRTANTLRYFGGNTTTNLGATNTLTLNGLMNAATANTYIISGGPSTGGILIGSTGELVVTANAQNTTISAVIAGSGGRLVYAGGGTLALGGANTFDGGLVINSGTVAVSADANAGAGSITINRAGTLSTNNAAYSREITLNGGTLAIGANGASSGPFSGDISLAANSTISTTNTNSGVGRISGSMLGTGGFTKTGTGGLQLNATSNTYTGPTVVSTGGLTVKSSLYGNDTAQWTPANITVASGATFMLNVGGTGEFTTTQAATMFNNLATGVTNNGLLAGSIIGVDTRNADAGTYTYSGVISDSAGPGGGAVGFKHSGKGSTILEMTGANTYSGPTFVDGNGTLRVSSFNSVFTNPELGTVHMASSSLGAPTTVANGTIHLGVGSTVSNIGNSFDGGSLIYTGTGEITDRVISLNDGGNRTHTIDQSGSGHLKFLSSFASGDNRAIKTINLQGSTAGTAELAGTIPNAGNGTNRITKNGTGTWTLSGTNLYLGTTTIGGGTLQFAKQTSLYNNIEANWTKTNLIVNSGGTLALNVGGTGEFTNANVTTLLTNLTTSINNNGLRAGSRIGFDTTNSAGGTFTIADTIANSTGTGGGAVGLSKLGTGTLELAGTNSYTGTTLVNAGKLLVNGDQSSASGNISVAANATLGGTGTIGGDLNIADNGKLEFNLSSPPGTHDQLELASLKAVLFDGASTLTITSSGGGTTGTYTLITAPDGFFGTLPAVTLPAGWTADPLAIDGNDLVINITSAGSTTPYDTWAGLKGLTGANNAKNLDPDNDGRNNLAEFAFDGDPLSGINDGKIVGKIATVGSDQVMTLTLPVRTGATFAPDSGDQLSALIDGIYYRIEGDVNLSTFADTITEVTGGDATAIQTGMPLLSTGWTYRTFRAPGTVPTTPKAFLRAKVSETP